MTNYKFTGKHILLLLVFSPGSSSKLNEGIIGRTRLIKMMFLFEKEIKRHFVKDSDVSIINFPEFYAWDFGPFSKDIYNDIEFLSNNNFLNSNNIDESLLDFEIEEYKTWIEDFTFDNEKELLLNDPQTENFLLTKKGIEFVRKNIYNIISDNQKAIIKNFKEELTLSSLNSILRYTYLKYPSYSTKSKIKEKVIG